MLLLSSADALVVVEYETHRSALCAVFWNAAHRHIKVSVGYHRKIIPYRQGRHILPVQNDFWRNRTRVFSCCQLYRYTTWAQSEASFNHRVLSAALSVFLSVLLAMFKSSLPVGDFRHDPNKS